MKTWNFGIIGVGGIASFHRDALLGIGNARISAVAGRSAEKTKAFADSCGCTGTTDYRELLARDDVDVVCVTTGSGSHSRIGEDALRAGKHLVVEKPVTMTREEAERLIQLAETNGLLLSVISQRRFEPNVAAVKRAIDEGRLGKLLLIESGTPYFRTQQYYDSADWRGTIAEDGGALMNQGIHQIDLLLWFGGPARTVYGKTATQTHRMEAEDIGTAIVTFENGAIGTILSTTSVKPGFPQYIHVYGEKGTIKLQGQSIAYWNVEDAAPPSDGANVTVSDGSSNPLALSPVYHRQQLTDVIAALEAGREPSVTGRDGKRAVALIQAIIASSAEGREITLHE